MTHYLRKNGKSIVDIEVNNNDIDCVVCIKEYSKFLLSVEDEEIIDDFDKIQEIRGEYWEVYRGNIDPDFLARKRLIGLAAKYNLEYVTD